MTQTKISLFPSQVRLESLPKSPQQLGLWPLKSTREYPPDESNGCHYAGKVIAENGFSYIAKTIEGGRYIPISEMVGYELCSALGIATPACDRIEMFSKQIAFGSRIEKASGDGSTLAALLVDDEQVIHTFGNQISKLVVLDVFLSNTDRSFRNLRWLPANEESERPSPNRQGSAGAVIAIDYSRAFMASQWPLPAAGFHLGCPSLNFYRSLRNKGFFIGHAIGLTLNRILHIPGGFMEMIVSKCDPSWITRDEASRLMQWWSSSLRGARVQETERYLKNELKIPVSYYSV